MNLLDRIRMELEQFSGAEQAVAQLVLKDPSGFQKMPVTELAKRAGVSSPSVVRFCRSLGYEGLSDFKLKLAASLNAGVPFIHQSVKAGDSGEILIQKVLDNAIHTLRTFRNTAPAKPIDKATQLLAKTIEKKVGLFSMGWAIRGLWRWMQSTSFSAWVVQRMLTPMGICRSWLHPC